MLAEVVRLRMRATSPGYGSYFRCRIGEGGEVVKVVKVVKVVRWCSLWKHRALMWLSSSGGLEVKRASDGCQNWSYRKNLRASQASHWASSGRGYRRWRSHPAVPEFKINAGQELHGLAKIERRQARRRPAFRKNSLLIRRSWPYRRNVSLRNLC